MLARTRSPQCAPHSFLQRRTIPFLPNKNQRIGRPIQLIACGRSVCTSTQPPTLLDPVASDIYHSVPLIARAPITHNTDLFTFQLPTPQHTLGLQVGQHVFIKAIVNSKPVLRAYTPVSTLQARGQFDLAVKMYPTGLMSQFLLNLKIGDNIEVKGPKGKFTYNFDSTLAKPKLFCMVAGGSGITPMLQIIRAVLHNPADCHTRLKLIYGNVTLEDILFKSELDTFAATNPKQFSLHYTLDKPPVGWQGGEGHITLEMMKEQFGDALQDADNFDNYVLFCGPPLMTRAVHAHLEQLGFPKEKYHRF